MVSNLDSNAHNTAIALRGDVGLLDSHKRPDRRKQLCIRKWRRGR
jgi:hypothetical protein